MSKAKATSVPQLGNHSEYFSHVGAALNLIDESKSLPVEANNSTIKLHLPVEAKEKIVMIDESDLPKGGSQVMKKANFHYDCSNYSYS